MKEPLDKSAILAWVRDNPERASKRDIARAFDVKGAARIELKRMIREMRDEGEEFHLAQETRENA